MDSKTITRIGPNWLDVIPKLPEGTWEKLNGQAIENMPWEGMVANLDTSVWGKMSFVALNKFPDRYWENVPITVWQKVPPGTWARVETSKINVSYIIKLRRR